MKAKSLILTITITILVSCTPRNNVEMNNLKRNAENRNYIEDVISTNREIFGDVLILDSLESAYNLLEHFSSLQYQDLRSEYAELGFHNIVIESNIVYDSLFQTFMDLYGITEDDEFSDLMIADLQEEVISHYSEIIPLKLLYDEELGHEIGIFEPIGDFDLDALTNEMGIFIADTFVYKLFQDERWCVFTISSYPRFAEYEYEELYDMYINGNNNDDFIPDLEYVYFYDYPIYNNSYFSANQVVYSNDKKYRMNVSLDAHAKSSHFYGTTTLYTDFQLKNYKLGCFGWFYWLTSFPTTGEYHFQYQAYKTGNPHNILETVHSYINQNSRRISQRHIIARFADHYFEDPFFGLVYHSFDITNERVHLVH